MAYNTPYTFIALQALTASQMNGIQTNISALWPYSAAGDISYASASNTLARLAKGTLGESLRIFGASELPYWSPAFGCQATRTTAQSIANSTTTLLSYDAENFDDANFHDNSTNPERITIPSGWGTGRFLIVVNCIFNIGNAGQRHAHININGVMVAADTNNAEGAETAALSVSTVRLLNDGDYVTSTVFQDSGSALDITVSTYRPTLTVMKL